MHPSLAPLAFLVGRWAGTGTGVYPTIDSFAYDEEISITSTPKPVLRYEQRTADPATGEARHAELGWFRMTPAGPELVVAQPTGITEVHAGLVRDHRVELRSLTVGMTPTAAGHAIGAVERVIEVEGDTLRYTLSMAASGQPLQVHLQAELHRT